MTINTIQDFNRDIELLTDKMRQIKLSAGIHTSDGYRFKYEIAVEWDGVSDAPDEIIDLSDYMGTTPIQAKDYIISMYATLRETFRKSDILKYAAKKEALLSDKAPSSLVNIYNKHLAIFENAMYVNV